MVKKRNQTKPEHFIKDTLIFSNASPFVISLRCKLTPGGIWRIASETASRAVTKAHKKSVRSSSISFKGNKKKSPYGNLLHVVTPFYRLDLITLCTQYCRRFVVTCAAHLCLHFASRAGNPLMIKKDSSEVYKGCEWKNPPILQVRTTLKYKAVVFTLSCS